MERRFSRRSKAFLFGVGLLAAAIAVVGIQRHTLLRWYTIRGLARAGESDRQVWIERVAGLGTSGIPSLIDCLAANETVVCANVQAGLNYLIANWSGTDPRRAELAERLAASFARCSGPGQQVCLELEGTLLRDAGPQANGPILASLSRVLQGAAQVTDEGVHRQAVRLAAEVLDRTDQPEAYGACREVACACFKDEATENRRRAVHLALRPGMKLAESLTPLLHDPVAEIRRLAILGVGSDPDAISTDDLLPWLHDPDADVRYVCEQALRSRGLQERHLQLGRLMTAGQPGTRLQVLDLLRRTADLEPGVWLRRLSHDPAPAVRAAAVRAAGEEPVNLSDRLEQMAQNDPCPTVRQLAVYYLHCPKSRQMVPVEE